MFRFICVLFLSRDKWSKISLSKPNKQTKLNQVNNYMKHTPSRDKKTSQFVQKFCGTLYVLSQVYERPPLVHILRQINVATSLHYVYLRFILILFSH